MTFTSSFILFFFHSIVQMFKCSNVQMFKFNCSIVQVQLFFCSSFVLLCFCHSFFRSLNFSLLCMCRWHNHLNPQIVKKAWTEEEDVKIIELHKIHGNKWAEISKHLSGRSVIPHPTQLMHLSLHVGVILNHF